MKTSPSLIHGILCSLILLVAPVFAATTQEPPAALQETEPAADDPEAVSAIKEITHRKVPINDRLVVEIKVAGSFLMETFVLSGPKRLVIDFSPVPRIEAPAITEVNDTGLRKIRAGQFLPSVARLVFDLDEPAPSFSISSMPDGVKVFFWREAVPPPAETPEPEAGEKPGLKPVGKPVAPAPDRSGFFLRGGPGMTFFLKPSFAVVTDRATYGETASLTETLRQKTSPVFELSAGKLINPKFRAGLGVVYQMLSMDPALEGLLPHPLLPNKPREVYFEAEDLTANMWILSEEGTEERPAEKLRSGMWTVSAWGLYSFFQTDTIDLSAGPIVGLSFGTLYSMEDYVLEEKSPYESRDVTVDKVRFLENSFSKLDPGFLVSGTYLLNDRLFIFATIRVHYADVMVEGKLRRASLFRMSFNFGLEYGF